MQDTNNSGSDDQESSSADRYLAGRAKQAEHGTDKTFPVTESNEGYHRQPALALFVTRPSHQLAPQLQKI